MGIKNNDEGKLKELRQELIDLDVKQAEAVVKKREVGAEKKRLQEKSCLHPRMKPCSIKDHAPLESSLKR